jgi:hypothetical protein
MTPQKLQPLTIQQRRFSTGVGGAGNMSSISSRRSSQATEVASQASDDDERAYQDRSANGIVLVSGGHHTGIGTTPLLPTPR